MPLPTCGTIAGLPLTQQVAAIYCALYEGAGSPVGLPSCECVAGRPLAGMLQAIYCILYLESEDESLQPCGCVSGNPINSAFDAIYCAAYIQAGSPVGLDSCACVKWKNINQKVDAIYCVFYTQAGSPEDLLSCDCVRGLPLNQKLDAIYLAILENEPPPEGSATLLVEWTDNSDDEDGFEISISINGSDYFLVGTVPAGQTQFLIENLEYNTKYWVRVVAFNIYGQSAPAEIEVYTCTEFGPTNCTATTIDDQSVFVTYTDSVTQPINGGYKVYYKESSAPSYDPNDFILNAIGEQEGTVSGLNGSTSYDFIAVTYNDNSANVPPQIDSESVPSNTATATTDPSVTPPTMLSAASNAGGTQVTLTASAAVKFGAGGNGGFTSTGRTWTYVSGFTGTTTAVYGVSPAIAFAEVVTVDYTQPGNGIEDNVSSTDMASFTGLAVTNNVPNPYLIYILCDGTGTPPGWTNGGAGTVNWASTSSPLEGLYSLNLAAVAQQPRTSTTYAAQNEVWVRIQFRINTPFGANKEMVVLGSEQMVVRTTNALNGTGTGVSVNTLTTGTKYWVWIHAIIGTGANAFLSVAFNSVKSEPVSGNSYVQKTNGANTTQFSTLQLGWTGNATGDFTIDEIILNNSAIGNA